MKFKTLTEIIYVVDDKHLLVPKETILTVTSFMHHFFEGRTYVTTDYEFDNNIRYYTTIDVLNTFCEKL